MTVWFSNSAPVKGVCIDTYQINEFGDILDNLDSAVNISTYSSDVGTYDRKSRKTPPVELPFRRSPTASNKSRISEPQSGSNLQGLVHDAQLAFQEILTRNASLEQEVSELRNQSYCDSSTIQSLSSRKRTPGGMLTRRNLDSFPTFNISTPPRDFIDLSQPHRIHSRK